MRDVRAAQGIEADGPAWARGWRRALLATGLLTYPALTATGAVQDTSGASAVIGCAMAAAFAALLMLDAAIGPRRTLEHRLTFTAMSALFVAEVPLARDGAFFLCAALSVPAIARLGRAAGPLVGAAALASVAVPWAVSSWHSGPGWAQALSIVFTALITRAYLETVCANRALIEARAEIADLASEAERARIARDLHDLLGHSLTAITMKSGLAHRLAARDPERAAREIAEVEVLSRQALAEVRAAVSSYRDVTVRGELARGRELLRAAGVIADLPTAADVVDAAHQELLGWAVREGLTNVARHARATRCTVTLSAAEVEIRDDGVGGPAGDGNGLKGLRERVAAAGGRMEAGPLSPCGWRLRVSLRPAGPVSA